MITELTELQKGQLKAFKKRCLSIGFSTDPIKRDLSQTPNIDYLYEKFFNLPPPNRIIYVDSPWEFNYSINSSTLLNELCNNSEHKLDSELSSKLDRVLSSKLVSKLRIKLWSELDSDLWNELVNKLWMEFERALKIKLGSEFVSDLGSKHRFYNIYYGNIDIYWLSCYLYPEMYLGIKYTPFQKKSLDVLLNLFKSIGYIWFFEKVCFISDRPCKINRNELNQLHCVDGMALEFRDGHGICALNGRIKECLI